MMYTYKVGGKKGQEHRLEESNNRVVVRTKNARPLAMAVASSEGKQTLENFKPEVEFPEHDVTILKTRSRTKNHMAVRDDARAVLKKEAELKFAGRVLVDANTQSPVVYTENIFIKFFDNISSEACEKILASENLVIKERPEYAKNAFLTAAPEGTGLKIFDLANRLLQKKEVELCHPEVIRKRTSKLIHPKQWHLKETTIGGKKITAGVNADKAHLLTRGENTIIAIIDDGVDINNPEFNIPGKVVASRDISSNANDPRPRYDDDVHGTACAGVATASGIKASGVAPAAKLMPIRLSNELGSADEARAFKWAADHGADVISCSWGPQDGDWAEESDPLHTTMVPLADSTRLAMLYAVTKGRNGKGCVITYAAGNGNEDTCYDGYASSEFVMAIAACSDSGKKSVYSDYGKAVWCSFPSNDFGYSPFLHPEPATSGIYTTDRIGPQGYNRVGDYTDSFGGTSSACPGVAGVAALILSVNPELTWKQVRDIIKSSCEKIDIENGKYNAQQRSIYYGFGRINAERAVLNAQQSTQKPLPASIIIKAALVNPAGKDRGKETVELFNPRPKKHALSGWTIRVNGKEEKLSGFIEANKSRSILLNGSGISLPNNGGTIALLDDRGTAVHTVKYEKKQVVEGKQILF